MKRFVTILIIILVVVGIILVGAWIVTRRTATKNNTPAPTFREFLTGETPEGATPTTTPTDTSGTFTDDLTPAEVPNTGSLSSPGTRASQFTTTPLSPTEQTGGQQGSTGGTNGTPVGSGTPTTDTGTDTTTTGSGSTDQPATPGASAAVASGCSEPELNIKFTDEEIKQLKALQNRFYAIADTLYTDANVATEIANWSSFTAKASQLKELYRFCSQPGADGMSRSQKVAAANPDFKYRTPTPFWYDKLNPNGGPGNTFTGYLNTPIVSIPTLFNGNGSLAPGPNGVNYTKKSLEGALRLNLW